MIVLVFHFIFCILQFHFLHNYKLSKPKAKWKESQCIRNGKVGKVKNKQWNEKKPHAIKVRQLDRNRTIGYRQSTIGQSKSFRVVAIKRELN